MAIAPASSLAVGGAFTSVSGKPQQGFAIFVAGVGPPQPVEFVSMATPWRYHDTGTDLGTAWSGPAYGDSSWPSGLPQFGYGDGDETTVVSYGPDPNHKYITTYFRTSFNAASLPIGATIDLVVDDGAVVYLNGSEVLRDNMPSGTITFSTLAASTRDGSAENLERAFAIDPSDLLLGTNVLAVEIHQSNGGSSDISFSLRLVGELEATGDTTPPSAPANLRTTSVTGSSVGLAWDPSTDDVGVTAYDVYRDSAKVGETSGTTFSDSTVLPSTTYQYTVRARDAAGNQSNPSAALAVTTPALPGSFADGFESGTTSAWTVATGLTIQSTEVHGGTYAARGTTTNGRTWVAKDLPTSGDVTFQAAFKLISQSNTVNVLRFQTSGGAANVFTVFVSSAGFLSARDDVTGPVRQSGTPVDLGFWHVVRAHLVVSGTTGTAQVWLDGIEDTFLGGTQNFGTAPVGRFMLGDNSSGRPYDVVLDDAVITRA